ncbi:MAG: polysaccharide biosynthesis protein [Clostridia bacterium]|nr:polysaccharide biosynthesis protein [Clostridia bacterium]
MSSFKQILKNSVIKGTFILTFAGLISKLMGFYYKIFLSGAIGAEGIGLYQLAFPVMGIALSVCSMGIENAISRFCAKESDKNGIFTSGIMISLCLAFIISFIIYNNSGFIAHRFLLNDNAAPLISVISLSIPFSCIHQCVNGYYYGLKKTKIPALSQLFEQLVRVGSVLLITYYMHCNGNEVTPVIAVAGIAAGEAASSIFSLAALKINIRYKPSFGNWKNNTGKIIGMAFPISCNRVLLTLLQSGEAILIPAQLIIFGMTRTEALSAYGVLTGMAMSFITFPSTIPQSAAIMLLPTVSEAQSGHDSHLISQAVTTSINASLVMGIFCVGGFIIYGAPFGALIFHNELVSDFLRVLAWLCPFLYVNTTLTGILNGLGKTGSTFMCNIIGIVIRIAFIIFLIPAYGISGCMWGLLASQIFITAAYVFILARMYPFRFNPVKAILLPVFALIISVLISLFIYVPALTAQVPYAICLILGVMVAGIVYCSVIALFYRKNV